LTVGYISLNMLYMNDLQRIAELYDVSMKDWIGEVQFYRDLVSEINGTEKSVLEIACGTGRIALQLAKMGIDVVGIDISPEFLEIARRKNASTPKVEFINADMRSFQLNRRFPLVIIPGHSFQALITVDGQLRTLRMIADHLTPNGKLVIHVNHDAVVWLAEKSHDGDDPNPSNSKLVHPATHNVVYRSVHWQYKPAEQTAYAVNYWKETNHDGNVQYQWVSGPNAFHVYFPFEMEHLFRIAGYRVNAVFGDFDKSPLTDDSPEMIWIVQSKD
jgi:ubiquinone/menaquinone biosynthesis C-methylase UbiE